MTPDKPEGVWIPYRPGDPVPSVPVRIRDKDGWESESFLPGQEWTGWDDDDHFITAYMIKPGTAEAVRRERIRDAAEDMLAALGPFARFAENIDADGWVSNIHREGISVWFGPSDFRAARAAIAKATGQGGDA